VRRQDRDGGAATVGEDVGTPVGTHSSDEWSRLPRSSLEGVPESCGTFADYASGCMTFAVPGDSGELMSLAWGGNVSGAPAFTTASTWYVIH
jgi:hypothetical protein